MCEGHGLVNRVMEREGDGVGKSKREREGWRGDEGRV